MALIECPECRREVSSSAATCPTCAYPVATGTPPIPHHAVKLDSKRDWVIPALSIAARLGVGGTLFLMGANEVSSGMLGGLIIAGSAVPTFFRAWKARLKPVRPDAALVDGLADRMVELEHMHREQIADLEERIEFAERLLTKQREIGPS